MPSTLRGNLAVGQSGGPTAVINATLVGVLHEAGKHAAVENIYGLRHGVEGLLKEDLMDLGGVSEELLERIKHTPAAALGSCRRKLRSDDYTRILEVFRAHNIRYFPLQRRQRLYGYVPAHRRPGRARRATKSALSACRRP